jgi:hypothetical protein
MSSQETVHGSLMQVTPTSGKGTLDHGGVTYSEVVGLRADISLPLEMALGRGQTTEVGAYANQRLNLAKLGRPMEEMPWFRTGPGKTGRPGLSGGPAKRSHGGIVNPSCNRKGKYGNPAPTAGARGFYPNQGERRSTSHVPDSEREGRAPGIGRRAESSTGK